MILHSVELYGFRSFQKKATFTFDPKFTLIIGPNSMGKTNLLESIHLLSRTSGFRERKLEELISHNDDNCAVKGSFVRNQEIEQLEVRIKKGEEGASKLLFINSLHKSLGEYRKRSINTVLFQPDDLLIVSSAASLRRQYFDRILTQTDYGYYQAKANYEKGLYKRNKILENPRAYSHGELQELLVFWDDYLIKQITVLQNARAKLVDSFNLRPQLNGMSFAIEYQPCAFRDSRDVEQIAKELKNRRTLTGPQLDEFVVSRADAEKKNLNHYGSRSEQRLAVLWLKISELKYFDGHFQEPPLLLMDDIFSELDQKNSERILKVANAYQTIVTTAHMDVLPLIENSKQESLKTITLNL